MTKQFLIQVQTGERTRFTHEAATVEKNLQFVTQNAINQMTTGPQPAVRVIECVDVKDENLEAFAKLIK